MIQCTHQVKEPSDLKMPYNPDYVIENLFRLQITSK